MKPKERTKKQIELLHPRNRKKKRDKDQKAPVDKMVRRRDYQKKGE